MKRLSLAETMAMEVVRLEEEIEEVTGFYEKLWESNKRLKQRVGELEINFRNVNRLEGRMDGISENYRQTHVHATKLQQRVLDLEESMRPAPNPPKTCGTCRHMMVNCSEGCMHIGTGCWRRYDGKAFYIISSISTPCDKHEEAK